MTAPVRLLNDPAVSATLRGDLARAHAAARRYDAAAKLATLEAALRKAEVAPNEPGAMGDHPVADATQALGAQLRKVPWIGKVALVVGLAGAGVVSRPLWMPPASRTSPTAPTSQSVRHGARTEEPSTRQADVQEPEPPASSDATPPAPTAPTEGTRATDLAPSSVSEAVAATATVRPRGTPSSRREIEQLLRIRELLPRDPAAAYRLARRSAREFPSGALAEEREALEVRALALRGDLELARRAFASFVARHPESPLRTSLATTLER